MGDKESQKTIDWYNAHASEYTKKIRDIVSVDQMTEFTNFLPAVAQILDAGCGGGRDSEIFHQNGHKVIGLDLSEGMLREAKKQNIFQDFAQASHMKLPLPKEYFDGVWAHGSLHHLPSHEVFEQAVQEFYRVLNQGGVLHLATQAQTGEQDSSIVLDTLTDHERFYIYFTPARLQNLLQEFHFEVLSLDHFKETDKKVNAGRKNVEWLVALAKKV